MLSANQWRTIESYSQSLLDYALEMYNDDPFDLDDEDRYDDFIENAFNREYCSFYDSIDDNLITKREILHLLKYTYDYQMENFGEFYIKDFTEQKVVDSFAYFRIQEMKDEVIEYIKENKEDDEEEEEEENETSAAPAA